jgi:pilus assembly protein CpaC
MMRSASFLLTLVASVALLSSSAGAQPSTSAAAGEIRTLELTAGRSLPITGSGVISKVTVVNPTIADVVVISESEVVFNGIAQGETDIILWSKTAPRRHYRVVVRNNAERRQILLSVKFAEVRKDALRQIGTSLLYKASSGSPRVGTGAFNSNANLDANGKAVIPSDAKYLTILNTFNSKDLLALLDAEESSGNARSLAEPNLMAANREEASFLAGGEIPVPVVQGGTGGQQAVTIQYREFGVRLNFTAEVLSDSLIKLKVRPEVSALDYTNGVSIGGFRVPALRTQRVESTVDVLQNRSLIISGLFNEEREQVKTGLPFLSSIPILGSLFSSQRWSNNESELIVVVTPVIIDPNNPRAADQIKIAPRDNATPAAAALERQARVKHPG